MDIIVTVGTFVFTLRETDKAPFTGLYASVFQPDIFKFRVTGLLQVFTELFTGTECVSLPRASHKYDYFHGLPSLIKGVISFSSQLRKAVVRVITSRHESAFLLFTTRG
jgi:hypothetical protein